MNLKSKEIRKALTINLIIIRTIKTMKDQIHVNEMNKKLLREIVCRDNILKKYKRV